MALAAQGPPAPVVVVAPRVEAVPTAGRDSSLASTGMPVAAALAGLVLLVVGGLMTWARPRG